MKGLLNKLCLVLALLIFAGFVLPSQALANHCEGQAGGGFSHPDQGSPEANNESYPCFQSAGQIGFDFALQLTNAGFVIALIVIGIGTILRSEKFGMHHTLPKLIVTAILINFSWFLAVGVIEISNRLGYGFLSIIAPGDPTSFFSINPVDNDGFPSNADGAIGTIIAALAKLLAKLIFGVLTFFVLVATSVMLVIRYIALNMLLAVMPIALLTNIFPNLEFIGGLYKKWQSKFVKWILFFPAAMFFIAVAFKMATNGVPANAGAFDTIIYLGIVIGILIGGVQVANQLGIEGAGFSQQVAGWATRRTAALAGRGLRGAGGVMGMRFRRNTSIAGMQPGAAPGGAPPGGGEPGAPGGTTARGLMANLQPAPIGVPTPEDLQEREKASNPLLDAALAKRDEKGMGKLSRAQKDLVGAHDAAQTDTTKYGQEGELGKWREEQAGAAADFIGRQFEENKAAAISEANKKAEEAATVEGATAADFIGRGLEEAKAAADAQARLKPKLAPSGNRIDPYSGEEIPGTAPVAAPAATPAPQTPPAPQGPAGATTTGPTTINVQGPATVNTASAKIEENKPEVKESGPTIGGEEPKKDERVYIGDAFKAAREKAAKKFADKVQGVKDSIGAGVEAAKHPIQTAGTGLVKGGNWLEDWGRGGIGEKKLKDVLWSGTKNTISEAFGHPEKGALKTLFEKSEIGELRKHAVKLSKTVSELEAKTNRTADEDKLLKKYQQKLENAKVKIDMKQRGIKEPGGDHDGGHDDHGHADKHGDDGKHKEEKHDDHSSHGGHSAHGGH